MRAIIRIISYTDIHHKSCDDDLLKTLQENEMNGIEQSAYLQKTYTTTKQKY